MNAAVASQMIVNAVYAAFTLYMLCILLRWLGAWIELDFHRGWGRLIARAADPLIRGIRNAMRKGLPDLGPYDFAPLVALLLVWVGREITTAMIA
jgi:uncharacterized protein YggT (Ycf19 family)